MGKYDLDQNLNAIKSLRVIGGISFKQVCLTLSDRITFCYIPTRNIFESHINAYSKFCINVFFQDLFISFYLIVSF